MPLKENRFWLYFAITTAIFSWLKKIFTKCQHELWFLFLSKLSQKKMKVKRTFNTCCFIQIMSSYNSWSKIFSSTKLSWTHGNEIFSWISWQVEMINCKAFMNSQCLWFEFIIQSFITSDKNFTMALQIA
jgi:hypothetical protein